MKHIEKEIRYIMTTEMYNNVKKKVQQNWSTLEHGYAAKELTVMYDNPNPSYSFYSPNVDGRLRLRSLTPWKSDFIDKEFTTTELPYGLFTWKQRLKNSINDTARQICRENEIEAKISPTDVDNIAMILENVLHCPKKSSYERIRETLYSNGIEIAFDRFPYGYVCELELKDETTPENMLFETAEQFGLNNTIISTISCDDLYKVLCRTADVEIKTDILFSDNTMPMFDDYYQKLKIKGGRLIV